MQACGSHLVSMAGLCAPLLSAGPGWVEFEMVLVSHIACRFLAGKAGPGSLACVARPVGPELPQQGQKRGQQYMVPWPAIYRRYFIDFQHQQADSNDQEVHGRGVGRQALAAGGSAGSGSGSSASWAAMAWGPAGPDRVDKGLRPAVLAGPCPASASAGLKEACVGGPAWKLARCVDTCAVIIALC